MAVTPVEVTLELTPRARFDIIDVRDRIRETHGDLLDVYQHHLYHSFHTTAGYLEQSLAARLRREMGRSMLTAALPSVRDSDVSVSIASLVRLLSW
jgi:hypothetical protein